MSETASTAASDQDQKICNTCLEVKPIYAFKTNGIKKDGSKYRTNKCRKCLDEKVNPRDDAEGIRLAKIAAVEKALAVSQRAMELISSV